MKSDRKKKLRKIYLIGGLIGADIVVSKTLFYLIMSRKSLSNLSKIDIDFEPEMKKIHEQQKVASINNFVESDSSDVFIKSFDNLKLHGYFIKNNSNKFLILIHGYQSEGKYTSEKAEKFYQMGFNVLSIDLRCFGKSEGDFISMGVKETRDVISWCDWINETFDNANIVIYGTSMGGAISMMLSGSSELNDSVKCIIEDCGYTSIWDEFSYQLKKRHIPRFPLLESLEIEANRKIGISLKEPNSLTGVMAAKVPLLFIHGSCDRFVPLWMMYKAYDLCNAPYKEKLVVDDARHAESYKVNPKLYWDTIEKFVNKFI